MEEILNKNEINRSKEWKEMTMLITSILGLMI